MPDSTWNKAIWAKYGVILGPLKKAEDRDTNAPARKTAPSPANMRPRKLLHGWKDICKALELPYGAWRRLKRMNNSQGGPIRTMGTGIPPQVFEVELISWQADMEGRLRVVDERRKSHKQSLAGARPWGRDNVRTDDKLGMSEQKRRSDLGRAKIDKH